MAFFGYAICRGPRQIASPFASRSRAPKAHWQGQPGMLYTWQDSSVRHNPETLIDFLTLHSRKRRGHCVRWRRGNMATGG
jgi:hypothetical protein